MIAILLNINLVDNDASICCTKVSKFFIFFSTNKREQTNYLGWPNQTPKEWKEMTSTEDTVVLPIKLLENDETLAVCVVEILEPCKRNWV